MKTPTMQDIKKEYFAPDQLEAGNNAANAAMELVNAANGVTKFNFDPESFPAGCGMSVQPINKRDKASNKTSTIGVCIGAIPDIAAVADDEHGNKFITDTVMAAMMAKLANAARPREDGDDSPSLPSTISDFITSNRPEGVLVAFRKLQSGYVKLLKSKGMKLMTEATLREMLQNAAFAEQQFPNVPQATWVAILTSMIKKAEKDGMIAGQMVDWLETRDTAGLPSTEEVDLTDMDFSAV